MIAVDDLLDGKYRVLYRLGSGGFGEVFLAEDEVIPGRRVAIKMLSRSDPHDHDDLIWEMQTLSRFQHAGVVAFHHHFEREGRLFLVMEHCAGGSLHRRLNGERDFSNEDVVRWVLDLCDTLAFVHDKGIVHHDVKPANVLFDGEGRIKLGDFGVANRATGTLLYMAPEMLLGERVHSSDPRVDIYALGLTMQEALTGRHPFEDLSARAALEARLAHDFVPESLPSWQQEVLLKATHPTPEMRFQTATEFAEAIRSRHVPYVVDAKRIKAHTLAERAENLLARKKWKQAERAINQALHLSPKCHSAILAAARFNLQIRRVREARRHFSEALAINPRTPVQKELARLNIEEGRISGAISLLTDHLERSAADYEAYNLLLQCYFLTDRFEAGEDLARTMMNERAPGDCFRNNRFLCRLLNGGYSPRELEEIDERNIVNPFIAYNLTVAREKPRAWAAEDGPALKSKLLFQDYRFDLPKASAKPNGIVLRRTSGDVLESSAPIISIGFLHANALKIQAQSISRRHAVIINYPSDVWLCDLGSTFGSWLDGQPVEGRMFLDGVHDLTLGEETVRIAASDDLLL